MQIDTIVSANDQPVHKTRRYIGTNKPKHMMPHKPQMRANDVKPQATQQATQQSAVIKRRLAAPRRRTRRPTDADRRAQATPYMLKTTNRLYKRLQQYQILQLDIACRTGLNFRKVSKFMNCSTTQPAWYLMEPIIKSAIDNIIADKSAADGTETLLYNNLYESIDIFEGTGYETKLQISDAKLLSGVYGFLYAYQAIDDHCMVMECRYVQERYVSRMLTPLQPVDFIETCGEEYEWCGLNLEP
ncbi:hypothetical protein F-VV10_0019 [Faustovirus]|nr:hypothetical protein F-VV10_0019 [Faustovirus]